MPVPSKVSRYELIGPLGAGASGQLFKAWDPYFERHVALKAIASDRSQDVEFQRRFQEKAQAVSKLKHPNIVQTYDWIEDAGNAYQVLELLDGTTLRGRMEAEKKAQRGEADGLPLSLKDKLRILIGVLRGLHRAHETGVIHGDLDPGKIFIPRSGDAKVLDFGLGPEMATIAPVSPLHSMSLLAYLSPEHLSRLELDGRADIWACGVILYELLSGQLPFRISASGVLQGEPEPLEFIDPGLPSELREIVAKALARNRSERYRSASEMADELEWVLRSVSERNTIFELELAGVAERFLERLQENRDLLRGKLGEGVMDLEDPLDRSLQNILHSDLGDARTLIHRYSGDLARLNQRVDLLLRRVERARTLLMDAVAHEQAGDVKGALRKADRLVDEFPNLKAGPELAEALHHKLSQESNAERLVAAAREFQSRGNLERARNLVEEALNLEPQRNDALMLHQRLIADIQARAREIHHLFQGARQAELEGDLKTAFDLATKVVERDRAHVPAKHLAARVESKLLEVEKIVRARKVFDKAQLFMDMGEKEEALAFLKEALALDPNFQAAKTLLDRLEAEVENERRRESRRGFEERNAKLLRDAEKARDRGSFTEALEQAQAVSTESEARQAARHLVAWIETRTASKRRLDEARGLFEREEPEKAHTLLTEILALDGDFEEAVALCDLVEDELDRRDRSGRFDGALRSAKRAEKRGEHEQALALAREMLSEDPHNRDALFLVERVMDHQQKVESLLRQARSFLKAGRPEIALRRLNTLYPLEPDHPEGKRLRALAQEKLSLRTARGKVVFARKQIRRFPNAGAGLLAAIALAALVTSLLLIFEPFEAVEPDARTSALVAPAEGMGYAFVDASPWSELTWLARADGKVETVTGKVTPILLTLAGGSYTIDLKNHLDQQHPTMQRTFEVVPGETVALALAIVDRAFLSRRILDGWEPAPAEPCVTRLNKMLATGGTARQMAQELVRLVPSLPEGAEGEHCRELVDQIILNRRAGIAMTAGELASGVAGVGGVEAGEAEVAGNTLVRNSALVARGLLRTGDLAGADSNIGTARVLAPQDPLVVYVSDDLKTAWKASDLFSHQDYREALLTAAALVLGDPLNEEAEKLVLKAKDGFIRLASGELIGDDGVVGAALTMRARRYIDLGEIRSAWDELGSIPLRRDHPELADVGANLESRALGKAHGAVLDILSGERARGVAQLEDAIAALSDRPLLHLYLALGYYGLFHDPLESNEDDLVKARDAIWQALLLDRNVEPPQEWFSPPFVELVRDMRRDRKLELDALKAGPEESPIPQS